MIKRCLTHYCVWTCYIHHYICSIVESCYQTSNIIDFDLEHIHMCHLFFRPHKQVPRWYKFDDGEVTECKMDDDEEIKNQCFGGDYLGEVFDHMLKR